MTCEAVREMLGAYLDGELDANAEFQMRNHLADCEECTKAYHRLQSLRQAIRDTAVYYTAPRELETQIRSSLRPEKLERKPNRLKVREWIALAASVLIAVSLGLNFFLIRATTRGASR